SAEVMRARVGRGECDLWIGQLAEPVASPSIWWSAAFAAGNDDSALRPLQQGADSSVLAKQFADREPIVPLMFRSVRLWHRTDLKGLELDAMSRPCFADAFLFGSP